MKRMALLAVVTLTLVASSTLQIAGQSRGTTGFDKLKSLVGEWQGKRADGKAVVVTYQLVSGGHGIMERLEATGEDEMVTIYHPDADGLMLTHYCSAGNQPRMRARVPAGEIRNLNFAFIDATNLAKPSDGHIHSLAISFQDKDQMMQVWIWRQDGRDERMTFTLQRKK